MSTSASTIELLDWVACRPRTYDEAIEAWKTSCPRLSVWDDALIDGLVRVVRGSGPATVALTPLGRAALAAASAACVRPTNSEAATSR